MAVCWECMENMIPCELPSKKNPQKKQDQKLI